MRSSRSQRPACDLPTPCPAACCWTVAALWKLLSVGIAALRQFLDSHDVDRAALEAERDRLVEQAHEEATGADDSPPSDMPPELAELLEPIFAAAAAGQDVEPLLAGLRERLVEMGADESQIDGVVEMIRSRLKSPE